MNEKYNHPIQLWAKAKGISRTMAKTLVADVLGVKTGTVSQYVCGYRRPNKPNARRIARLIGCTPDELFR